MRNAALPPWGPPGLPLGHGDEMALQWTVTGRLEARKSFDRLKAYRQLPFLRNILHELTRKK